MAEEKKLVKKETPRSLIPFWDVEKWFDDILRRSFAPSGSSTPAIAREDEAIIKTLFGPIKPGDADRYHILFSRGKFIKKCMRGDCKMAEMVKVCNCDKCGNEAEMTITCKTIDVEDLSGVKKKMQEETRVCKVCGNEANMIIDFDS